MSVCRCCLLASLVCVASTGTSCSSSRQSERDLQTLCRRPLDSLRPSEAVDCIAAGYYKQELLRNGGTVFRSAASRRSVPRHLAAGDWPSLQNRANRTGLNDTDVRLAPGNVGRLVHAWTAPLTGGTGDGPDRGFDSSPVVGNGIVYVGSSDGRLYAFDARSGKARWIVQTSSAIDATPAVANGVVFVVPESYPTGKLSALDAGTGKKLWSTYIGFHVASSPAVSDGIVYAASGGDGHLDALKATTGKRLWGEFIYTFGGSPAVAGGVVYVGTRDRALYAFIAKTGKPLWVKFIRGIIRSAPAVADGVVYVHTDRLYAFDARTGSRRWTHRAGTARYSQDSPPAVAHGTVYVGSIDHHLYAIDAESGQELWRARTGDSIVSAPAVANGVVFVGSWDHRLYAFDATSGKRLWSATTGSIIRSSPAVAHGFVYVASKARKLYAYRLATTNGSIGRRP
jgi:outer membrane protein assembly factor BamB